jgi:heme/copper-type cytochrome/quinol oxidase subunit 2
MTGMFKNNVIIIALTTVCLAVIAAFVFVLVRGADTDKLANFLQWLLTVVPIVIVGIITAKSQNTISNQVTSVGQGVTNVETATNGMLSARLNAQTQVLKDHIDTVVASQNSNVPTS